MGNTAKAKGDGYAMARKTKHYQSHTNTVFSTKEMSNPRKRAETVNIINRLPIKQRTALLMYEYGRLGIEDVAEAMDTTCWLAEHHIQDAREQIRMELEINSYSTNRKTPPKQEEEPILVQVLTKYAEETITGEQLDHVLAPVLQSIKEGEFDKPSKNKARRLVGPLSAVAAIIILVASVLFYTGNAPGSDSIDIFDGQVPLAMHAVYPATSENRLSGRVYYTEQGNTNDADDSSEGISGIEIQLLPAGSDIVYLQAFTGENGEFEFKGFPDRVYRLQIILHNGESVSMTRSDMNTLDRVDNTTATVIIVNGDPELTFGNEGYRILEGVDIPIWKAG